MHCCSTGFWKNLLLLNDLGTFVGNQFIVYFWTLCFVPLIYVSVLLPVSHYLDFVTLKMGHVSLPTIFSFLSLFWLFLHPLTFCMSFRMCLSVSAKDFYRDHVESVDQYGDQYYLNSIKFSHPNIG